MYELNFYTRKGDVRLKHFPVRNNIIIRASNFYRYRGPVKVGESYTFLPRKTRYIRIMH